MKIQEKKQVIGILISLSIIILSVYLYKSFTLRNGKETFAIFVEKNIGVGITQKYFEYKLPNGEVVKASVVYNEDIEIGDTVWVKYSTSNPQIITVIDKNYKRHLGK